MKKSLIVILLFFALVIGCVPSPRPAPGTPAAPATEASIDSCSSDSDCVCGGVEKSTGRCFLGNREYYEKNVDKSKQCPDFCSGIAGNLVVRCVDDKCIQMYECIADSECGGGKCVNNRCSTSTASECSSDSDCSKQGCSGQLCRPKSAGRIVTTCEYRPEYDCLKMIDCGCVNGQCKWRTDSGYDGCVERARGMMDVPV
jgi:eight-cysteine-cluster-containing protein